MAEASPHSAPAAESDPKPVCIVCLGMAGSGKTTFVQRLNAHLHERRKPPYTINLDPAVRELPYPANIDICDTIDYKSVMKDYSMGPNGAIVTSLNLFATRFDQVLAYVERQQRERARHVLIDTPGQIEVFTWSASGAIITESLAASFPTVVAYIIDTPRCANPVTFMSNMLYACSILYRTKLPFVVVLNKTDVIDPKFAIEWMRDFDAFHAALAAETSYVSGLARSMALVLNEFYQNLSCVGVSAALGGACIDEFFSAVDAARVEYETVYRPQIERLKRERDRDEETAKRRQLERLRRDMGRGEEVAMTVGSEEGEGEGPIPTGGDGFQIDLDGGEN